METWAPIPGFPLYEITCCGKIRNRKTLRSKSSNLNWQGRLRITLHQPGSKKSYGRYVHCLVWETFNGPKPKGMDLDHIDQNPANPHLSNLRLATRAQNSHRKVSKNKYGYRGVYKSTLSEKFLAKLRVNGKHVYLGSFDTVEEAARAHNAKALEVYGEFALITEVL